VPQALDVDESRLDDADAIDGNPHAAGAAVLHAPCRQLVDLCAPWAATLSTA
jgi:hypothetical protein